MQIVAEIFFIWIGASLVLGPIAAWIFFYPERRAGAIKAAHDRWIVTHPKMPLQLMPAWLRWEDTSNPEADDHKVADLPQVIARRH